MYILLIFSFLCREGNVENEKKEALLQLNFQTLGTEVFAFMFGG